MRSHVPKEKIEDWHNRRVITNPKDTISESNLALSAWNMAWESIIKALDALNWIKLER